MIVSKRQSQIMEAVRLRGACTIGELAGELAVTGETIRRNIQPLVARGLVRRVHGGIVLPEGFAEPPFQRRMREHREAKLRIAEAVAAMVADGDSLMLDTGSTTAYVALALGRHSNLLIITNCLEIARTLTSRNGNRVYLAGGELRADDAAIFGPAALEFVRQFEVDHAVLSIGAVSRRAAFMDYHLCESEFSRAVIGQAAHVIVAADQSTLGRRAAIKVCDADAVDVLVTDAAPPAPYRPRLHAAGVEVRVAAAP